MAKDDSPEQCIYGLLHFDGCGLFFAEKKNVLSVVFYEELVTSADHLL